MGLTESGQERTVPNFDTKLALKMIKGGVFFVILSAGMIYAFVSILFRGNTVTILQTWYMWTTPFLILISLPLLLLLLGIIGFVIGASFFISKKKWMDGAANTQATILDRKIVVHSEYDEYNTYQIHEHEMVLQFTRTKARTSSVERIMMARVDKKIYDEYKSRDNAYIYYSKIYPSIFLIEGE
jgi:hypothetical protein